VSAAMPQPTDLDTTTPPSHDDEVGLTGTPVVVRRNAGLAALVGAGASATAIAYLWRATASGAPLDWVLCLVMAAIAALYLANLVDARTPLLVADDLGVRIRLGNQWRGLPWDAVERVVVRPRRGLFKDGRLMFAPYSLARALDGLDARGRRAAALNQKMYGAALAVPMGLTTRVSASGAGLEDGLAALSQGRAEVVTVLPEPVDLPTPVDDCVEPPLATPVPAPAPSPAQAQAPTPTQASMPGRAPQPVPAVATPAVATEPDVPDGLDEQAGEPVDEPVQEAPRRSLLGGIGTIVSRVAKGRSHDVDHDAARVSDEGAEIEDHSDGREPTDERDVPRPTTAAVGSAVPLRDTRRALRAQVTRDEPATVLGNVALHPDRQDAGRHGLPEGRELRRPGSVDLEFEAPPAYDGRVRPISTLGDPVDPLVVDDFATEPAYDPVIGPELAAARVRVGLSVDELAERTRIRPHVIESIEVDDFAPCGGDFYARGHLRTLARVLGKDPAPLLAQFDERYATAPINARKVFEAELATGMTGSMRSTIGGPNWTLLVGVVLVLVMTWGVVRLFASEPPEVLQSPAPVLNGSAGVGSGPAPSSGSAAPAPAGKPVRLMLVGAQDSSRVVVRDRSGKVVWAGEIVLGERRTVRAVPPVRVRAQDAGAIEVRVNGKEKGPLGELGEPGHRTFPRPSR
jgi:cytoskeleton protein RodZ